MAVMTFQQIIENLTKKAKQYPNSQQIAYIQLKSGSDKVVSEIKSGDHCIYLASASDILSKSYDELYNQIDHCITEFWLDEGFR